MHKIKYVNSISENGVTLIVLIVTIIVMLILTSIGIQYGRISLEDAKIENLKTEMLTIQSKAKIIADKNIYEGTALVGTPIEYEGEQCYRWTQADLESQGLGSIKVNDDKYYVVNYANYEIYSSAGYATGDNIYYSLTEIQGLD